MSRTINPEAFGPPGICDACGRRCGDMQQVGSPCYYCRVGVFMHRRFWQFTYVGEDIIATPLEDVTEEDVAAELKRNRRAIDQVESGGIRCND